MDQLPLWVLIVLILAAVAAGLYLGARAGKAVPRAGSGSDDRSLGARARAAATGSIVKLWKWNRARKRSGEKT